MASTGYGSERQLRGNEIGTANVSSGSTAVSRFADLSAGLQSLDLDRQTAEIRENPASAINGHRRTAPSSHPDDVAHASPERGDKQVAAFGCSAAGSEVCYPYSCDSESDSGLVRLHRALWVNHRYWFTTWRWGRVAAALLVVGAVLKVTMTG